MRATQCRLLTRLAVASGYYGGYGLDMLQKRSRTPT